MTIRLKPYNQQVVVIMGASTGMGRETAHQFAARGARVVAAARNELGLRDLADEIRERGGEATYIAADTADYAQVQAVAQHAVAAYGGIDTWAQVAGVSIYAPFEETTVEEFEHLLRVNLLGAVYGAKAALPHLRASGGGAFICVSSIEGIVSLPYQSAYAAGKHGVNGFMDALRLELHHAGAPISVTTIMPASINTPLFSHARTKLGVQPQGVPPFYSVRDAALAIVHAARHPTRELFVGDAAWVFAKMRHMAPKALDAFLLAAAFEGQRTDTPKSPNAPNTFWSTLEGDTRIRGEFAGMKAPVNAYNALAQNRTMATLLGGLLVGGAAAYAMSKRRNGD